MKKYLLLLFVLATSLSSYAQTNVSGVISSNTTWTLANSPYTVTGDIGIFPGATLTIDAGVTVNFSGDFQILNKGNVSINGTSANHITFNGNNVVGTKRMLMFKSSDLANSSINYVDFTGNQYAVQLADEAEHNEDAIKNSNVLTIQNSIFTNTGVFTKGYSTTAELVINNSTFDNATIKGYYPRTEPITLNNCTVDNSIINSDSYNYGINIFNSTIKNSTITMGCCSANFDIQNSIIYKTPISEGGGSPVNGDFKITNSKFIDSPINLNSAKFTITNSILSDKINDDLISLGNCTIVNSSFIGNKSKNAISISGRSGYSIGGSTSITTSLIDEVNNALVFNGVNTVSISSNNFINIEQYSLENLASTGFSALNNYWGTIVDSEIQTLIYDSYDNLDYGLVSYSPFLTTLNTSAPISPPINVTKAQSGSDVVFNWTANGESDTAGYKLYYGNPTGYSYSTVIDLGNVTTYTLTSGDINTEYAITAYDTSKDGTDDQVDGNESWYAVANQINVTLSASNTSISENGGTANIIATLSGSSSVNVVVNLTYSGTSIRGIDYTANTAITIPAGSLSASIALNASQDTNVELTETIIVDISSVNGGSEVGTQQTTINLTDDDNPTVSLAFSKTTFSELGGSTIITATQSAITSNLTTIDFTLTGTATTDTDYTTTFNSKGYSTVAGGNGSGAATNQLNYPQDVYVDSEGNIYIDDRNIQRIQKWVPGATSGITVAGGNGAGAAANQLNYPGGFSVDSTGNIYIADTNNQRIQKWTPGATSGITVAGGNGSGFATNQLYYPQGVYVDSTGNIYIADSANHRIQKWAPGASSGTTVAGGNGSGAATNQLNYPRDVYVDSTGNIYISDSDNNRIQKWESGASIGTTVGGAGSVNNPVGIYGDLTGNIYIADKNNHRIQKWTHGTTSYITVAGGNYGSATNQLIYPEGVYVDSTGNIYIADSGNYRIQKLQVSPQIKIAAGETTGILTLTGVEDTLNNEGDETIIITPTAINATLASSAATTITIQNYNQAPVATALNVTATEQTSLTITLTGTDAESDPLTYIVVTLPTNGTLTDPNNANANITAGTTITGTEVTYISTSDSATSDTFTFKVNDGTVDSAVATVNITITPVNDVPVATAQNVTATEQTDKTITLVGTDADNDTLTYTIVTSPTNGTAVLNANVVTYTSTSDTATSDSFTFKVNDGTVDSDAATVNITITPVNDAPVANDDSMTVDEGGSSTLLSNGLSSILTNDTDAEGDAITAILVNNVSNGTLVLNTDGTFTYIHNGSETLTDSFTYKANDGVLDGNIATVSITINPVNDNAPTDISLSNYSIDENINNQTIGTLTATDLDSNNTFTFSLASGSGDSGNSNFVIINGNELTNSTVFDYETQAQYSIRVKVVDSGGLSFEKIMTIDVTNLNDIAVNYVTSDSYCTGSQSDGYINITAINETVGNVSFSWQGPNGFISTTQNISNLEQGTYQLTVSDDAFQKMISIDVGLKPIYNDLSICYISSDNTQYTNNRIYFNNNGNYNVDKYQILREGSVLGVYDLIGEVNATENAYLDLTSDNNSSSYNYKVRTKDLCGNLSNESSIHRTLLLQSSVAIDNTVNLSWSAYEGVSYQTYKIYRSYNNAGFVELVSLSSSNLNYNDKTADVVSGNYKYYVSIAVSSCNTSAKNKSNKINVTNEIRSNQIILQSGSLGLADELFNNSIKFYPNPTSKILSVGSNIYPITKIEIYSALGKKVKEVNSNFKTIHTDDLTIGIYIIRIYSEKGISIRKLIKK